MRASSRISSKHILWLFLFLLLPASAFAGEATQTSQGALQANELWEQAIAAKGGREQLYRVSSLLISYQETARNFLGIAVHRGIVERLYVFPGKSWGWDDGLPPPFRLNVGWLDLERNRRCHLYKSAAAPVCRPANQGVSRLAEGINQVQYLYLMETKWVKPDPTSVTKGEIGFRKVDVLHTRFEDKRVDYFLDRKTHLPARVAVFYSSGDRPTFKYDFSDYVTINGIQMPGKQEKGKISFQLNPPFDEEIFSRPPSIQAGPKAWQRANK